MSDSSGGLINLDGLTKPITILVARVCDAIGVSTKPWQIRRNALAEADALKIKAASEAEGALIKNAAEMEIAEKRQAVLHGMIVREERFQRNSFDILDKAIGYLPESPQPEAIDDDWLINFFEKSKTVSDEHMQILWARILAEEAGEGGRFSKKSVNLLHDLDKRDALAFHGVCRYVWTVEFEEGQSAVYPIVFRSRQGKRAQPNPDGTTDYLTLKALEGLGLISCVEGILHLDEKEIPRCFNYFDRRIEPLPANDSKSKLTYNLTEIIFTRAGAELASICQCKPIEGIFESFLEELKLQGHGVEEARSPSS